jgi:hypothetical protein
MCVTQYLGDPRAWQLATFLGPSYVNIEALYVQARPRPRQPS